jgi:hypothetical protein
MQETAVWGEGNKWRRNKKLFFFSMREEKGELVGLRKRKEGNTPFGKDQAQISIPLKVSQDILV